MVVREEGGRGRKGREEGRASVLLAVGAGDGVSDPLPSSVKLFVVVPLVV